MQTIVFIVSIKGESFVFTNKDFPPAAVQGQAWLDDNFSSLWIPGDIETTQNTPAQDHAVYQVTLIVKIRLLLHQIANSKLLAIKVVVSLKLRS